MKNSHSNSSLVKNNTAQVFLQVFRNKLLGPLVILQQYKFNGIIQKNQTSLEILKSAIHFFLDTQLQTFRHKLKYVIIISVNCIQSE